MAPKRRGRPPGSTKLKTTTTKPTLKEKLLRMIGGDDVNENMIKVECLSNDDSSSFTNGDDDGLIEITIPPHPDIQTPITAKEKRKVYNCSVCQNKNFKMKEKYELHLLKEHSVTPGSVPCKKCHVVCPDKETLEEHMKNHNLPTIKCEHCSKQFTRQAHVLRHMAQRGCGKKMAKFPCEICHASFSRKDNLIVHLRTTHIMSNRFSCKSCTFTTKNFTKLTRHWHALHAETPNQFVCDLCGKITSSRAAMSKHNEIHGEKKYACDVCGYSTHTVEVIRRHVLTHVSDKPYKCNLCPQSYIQRSQLLRHLETHSGFVCFHCDARFPNRLSLLNHNKKHTEDVKLFCPYKDCEFSSTVFKSESSYDEHLQLHCGDEKLFSCEVCRKQFLSETNMRRHMRTHTLDRPRRCMYCVSARAYIRGMHLVRHVRNYHKDVFQGHLTHVRTVLMNSSQKISVNDKRVTGSELESILNLLDAEADRILEGCSDGSVLYGGMQENMDEAAPQEQVDETNGEPKISPLMSEEVLAENLTKLLVKLIDTETLECFGWPYDDVITVLEKVIQECGVKPAAQDWTRVQRLRENAKHLFIHVVDDKNVARMLDTHTIDQIIKHMLNQFNDRPVEDEQLFVET